MRLEAPVLVEAFAADRAAHLLRAGGAHRALVLVEAQAGGVEVEAERGEQGADFGFGIVDQRVRG